MTVFKTSTVSRSRSERDLTAKITGNGLRPSPIQNGKDEITHSTEEVFKTLQDDCDSRHHCQKMNLTGWPVTHNCEKNNN